MSQDKYVIITYYQNYTDVLTNAAKYTYTQRYINIGKEDNKLVFAKSIHYFHR